MNALWLVRHARVQIEAGVCYGRLEVEAEPAATAALAARLAGQLPPRTRLWVSPRQRCEKLAQALCKARPDLSAQTEPDLAEMDFGHWEGQRWDALGAAALDDWVQDFGEHRPGGGENVNAVLQRVAAALRRCARDTPADTDVAWLTHAGVIRAVHLLRQGRSRLEQASDWPRQSLDYGQVERLAPVWPHLSGKA